MWVFTTKGMYSAVEKFGDPTTLQIRARSKQDLLNLKPYIKRLKIVSTPNRDYPFRVFVKKTKWAAVMGQLASEIDYTNFKDEVKKAQGWERSSTYTSIWAAGLEIEEENEGSRKSSLRRALEDRYDRDYWPPTHDGVEVWDNERLYGTPVPEHWHTKPPKRRNQGKQSKLFEDIDRFAGRAFMDNGDGTVSRVFPDPNECPVCNWPVDEGCNCKYLETQ